MREIGGPAPSIADLTERLQQAQLGSFYVRPGYGQKGKSIEVFSNFFAVRAKGGRGKVIQ